MAVIDSPCIKICTLDPTRGLCLGCGRIIEEIARWSVMSAAERAAVMAQLPARLGGQLGGQPAAKAEAE